jgi:hypothetical protein
VKKKLVYAIATLSVLLASANIYAFAGDGGNPPPTCNPLTDPLCKP